MSRKTLLIFAENNIKKIDLLFVRDEIIKNALEVAKTGVVNDG